MSDSISLHVHTLRWYGVVSVGFAALTAWLGPGVACLLVGVFWLGYVLYRFPEVSIYGLVILSPMIGVEFHMSSVIALGDLSQIQWPLWVQTLYMPAVDMWAICSLCVWGLRLISSYIHQRQQTVILPGVWLYGAFLLSACISLYSVPPGSMVSSIGYLLRFLCFAYVGYVVLGVNLISSKTVVLRALNCYVWVSAVAAIMGIISFVIGGYDGSPFHRAVPMALWGVRIFDYPRHLLSGHILLAEMCTTAIPIALYLAYTAQTIVRRRIYTIVGFCICIACILTFSRAGWLTLCLQGFLYLFFFYSQIEWKRYKHMAIVVLCGLVPAVWYMYLFLQSSIVSSSNSARIALAEVGWYFFTLKPWFGQGVGMFTVLLKDVAYFTSQFGDAIDAHGVIQKIATEQGIFGVVSFLLFIWYIIFSIYKRAKSLAYSMEARMVAYLSLFLVISPLFFQLFNTQYYSARLWVPITLAIALNILYRHDSSRATVYISFVPEKKSSIRTNM